MDAEISDFFKNLSLKKNRYRTIFNRRILILIMHYFLPTWFFRQWSLSVISLPLSHLKIGKLLSYYIHNIFKLLKTRERSLIKFQKFNRRKILLAYSVTLSILAIITHFKLHLIHLRFFIKFWKKFTCVPGKVWSSIVFYQL